MKVTTYKSPYGYERAYYVNYAEIIVLGLKYAYYDFYINSHIYIDNNITTYILIKDSY